MQAQGELQVRAKGQACPRAELARSSGHGPLLAALCSWEKAQPRRGPRGMEHAGLSEPPARPGATTSLGIPDGPPVSGGHGQSPALQSQRGSREVTAGAAHVGPHRRAAGGSPSVAAGGSSVPSYFVSLCLVIFLHSIFSCDLTYTWQGTQTLSIACSPRQPGCSADHAALGQGQGRGLGGPVPLPTCPPGGSRRPHAQMQVKALWRRGWGPSRAPGCQLTPGRGR